MECPSCATPISWEKSLAQLVVCDACRSAIVVDEEAMRVAGKLSALTQTPSPLCVGAQGIVGKETCVVLGRVRYQYERGLWDEWYCQDQEGKTYWVGEDEGTFTQSRLQESIHLPPHWLEHARPGATTNMEGDTWRITERDKATCVGGEGQLPFVVVSGEEIEFVELSAGAKRFATVEFEDEPTDPGGSTCRVYIGRRIQLDHLYFPSDDPTATEDSLGTGGHQIAGRGTQKALECFACGAALDVADVHQESVECSYCAAHNMLTGKSVSCPKCETSVALVPEAQTISCPKCSTAFNGSGLPLKSSQKKDNLAPSRDSIPFKIGQKATLEGVDYILTGALSLRSFEEDEYYFGYEYLLYNAEHGYRWLIEEDGQYSLAAEVFDVPELLYDGLTGLPETLSYQERRYKRVAKGAENIVWVAGQLPYIAKRGDKTHYDDYVSIPNLLSVETSGSEQEIFHAHYVPYKDVGKAFGVDLPKPSEYTPIVPFLSDALWCRSLMHTAFLFMGINFFLWAFLSSCGSQVKTFSLDSQTFTQEFLTESFSLKERGVGRITVHSNIGNNWVYLDLALIDAHDQAVGQWGNEVSYYYGRSGGESWSEGSRSETSYFRIEKPGSYRLLVKGDTGSPQAPPQLTIIIEEGAALSNTTLFVMVAFFALGCFIALLRHHNNLLRSGEPGGLSVYFED
jgi:hypothetical protein